MAADARLRVQAVSIPDVSDYLAPLPAGKWSQLFGALSRRVSLVGISYPELSLSPAERNLNLARSFRLRKAAWAARAGFNMRHLAKRNAALERDLVARRGSYDLILQLQTLCSPRSRAVQEPYVAYTDSTMALTQRLYPPFAPLSRSAADAWTGFEIAVCRAAEIVFTCSEFARRSVIEDYGCPPERVAAVGAGSNQLLESLQNRDYEGRRALFVGSPFDRKGGPHLLDAWRLVHDRLPDAELVMVGPKRDPAPGFGRGVSWRGRLGRAELARLYRWATVFVLPSVFEPWGLVFGEAMGHGLPCIGSDCCAMPELIDDRVSGRLVAPGEAEPLADALIELLTDPDKARGMGKAGHSRVLEQMTWDHVVDRLVGRLEPALGGREARART